MIRQRFAAYAIAVLAALSISAGAQQPGSAARPAAIPDGKVAVINTAVFQTDIAELKQKYEQLDNQFKQRFEALQTLEQQLKQKESELQTKRNILSAEKFQELQSEVERLKRQGTRDLEDLRADFAKAEDATTKPVRDKLFQFISTYAGQRGIVLIFNLAGAAQTRSIAYFAPATDITQDFVAEYNKANPVPGVGAGPQRPGSDD